MVGTVNLLNSMGLLLQLTTVNEVNGKISFF